MGSDTVTASFERPLVKRAPPRGRRRRVPALMRRIVFINLLALLALVVGVLALNRVSEEVMRTQSELLKRQAITLATVMSEVAAMRTGASLAADSVFDAYPLDEPEEGAAAGDPPIDPALLDIGAPINEIPYGQLGFYADTLDTMMANIAVPSGVRIQLWDKHGRFISDTLPSAQQVDVEELPRPDAPEGVFGAIDSAYDAVARLFRDPYPPYSETKPASFIAPEEEAWVWDVVFGRQPEVVYRRNSANDLIMTAAAPIKQVQGVLGVLVVSTKGDAVDRLIERARDEIMRIFLIGAPVFVLLSAVLAATIARPIRSLATAAEETHATGGTVNPTRIRIPDLTDRNDEIGDLSAALRRMTDALYDRIDAIGSFAADVSHEIKNPLTSLRSAVETMRLAKTEEARERLLKVIEHDVGRMDRLVTDISNASRLDADLVRESQGRFDLGALAETVTNVAVRVGEKHGVEVVAETPDAPLFVTGMEGRLAQVLHNFIDNAVSFSPQGGVVKVRIWRDGDSAVAQVLDQGPGVPPENLHSVFERFYTERPGAESFGEHSGLGLSISRQIIEAHGGEIWAENRIGPEGEIRGAKFSFRIHL